VTSEQATVRHPFSNNWWKMQRLFNFFWPNNEFGSWYCHDKL